MSTISLVNEIFELTRIDQERYPWLHISHTEEDGYIFIYNYGEFAFHVFYEDGLYKFGYSERHGKVFVEAVSPDLANIERLLTYTLGRNYRKHSRLPEIRIPKIHYPYKEEDIKEGFSAVYLSDHEWVLQRPDGSRVDAVFIGYRDDWNRHAIYSYIMDIPVVDLVASYLDPDGYPALHEFVL